MPDGDLPIYSIGAVERMLGIPAATVRNWEDRYGLVQPERSGGGHRLYTRVQIEQLRFVKERLDRGLQPAEAHRLLGEELERGGEIRSVDDGGRATRLLILLAERDPYAAEFAGSSSRPRATRSFSPSTPTTQSACSSNACHSSQ